MKYKALLLVALVVAAAAAVHAQQLAQQPAQESEQKFRFRTGVELINVTATVTDANGRFVPGLRREDFRLYEDDQLQTITHFNAERVPVSLGVVLDTSGSMDGEKMLAARRALERFLYDLLGEEDEVFLYTFSNVPELVQGWTTDRRRLANELGRLRGKGGTAMYDAVAEAIPLAQAGRHRKKAIVVISDGNDTSSRTDIASLKAMIRETEVLVYAIGIDAQMTTMSPPFRVPFLNQILNPVSRGQGRPIPRPSPFPIPGRPRPGSPPPTVPGYPPYPIPPAPNPPRSGTIMRGDDRVNLAALRDMTDDSGGRTELVRSARDLDPATAGIADELSRQYYLGYPSNAPKDRRWHSIRVDVKNGYLVRARKGYVATP
jgi:VWFA-related protein